MPSIINALTASGGGVAITGDATGNLALQTAGNTAVTINTSQNVGIGTTTPTATNFSKMVQVAGAAAVGLSATSSSGPNGEFGALGGSVYVASTNAYPLIFAANNSETMRITTGQQVGIGANPSTTLYVNGSSYLTPYIGSGGLNIIASYAYNNGTANTIGGGYQDQVTTLMIATSGVGYTALPIYCNAGGGVAYRWTYLDPDAGTWVYSNGNDIDVTFINAGGVQNTYRVIITAGGGEGTIQRTAGSTGYTVYVQRLIGA